MAALAEFEALTLPAPRACLLLQCALLFTRAPTPPTLHERPDLGPALGIELLWSHSVRVRNLKVYPVL